MAKQHITFEEARSAAALAYKNKRLMAQSDHAEYAYEYDGYVCAIGACLNRDTLDRIEKDGAASSTIFKPATKEMDSRTEHILDYISFDESDRAGLHLLQLAHDQWFSIVLDVLGVEDGDSEEAEAVFAAVLEKGEVK